LALQSVPRADFTSYTPFDPAVIAAASPFIGQGESACLVKPFVDLMTPSEIHLAMCSGFSTISGSVLSGYILLGVP
jgi:CNT family concentrative nucleoside transporter